MSIELFFYLADVASNIAVFLVIFAIIFGFSMAVFFLKAGDSFDSDSVKFKTLGTRLGIAAIALCSISVLIPSKSTMYLMAGASVAKEVAASETGKRVQELVNKKLDEMLQEKKK
jgi:hypothetical protein